MTIKQENFLEAKLNNWSDSRCIPFLEQKMGFIGNLLEKMSEYYKAKDDDVKIEALCDIYILCMTSLDDNVEIIRSCVKQRNSYLSFTNIIGNVLAESELDDFDCWGNNDETIYKMMLCVEKMAEFISYNFYKCMLKRIKEIELKNSTMVTLKNKIIELKVVDLDFTLLYGHDNYQTLIVESNSKKDLYLLKDKTGEDCETVIGISGDLNIIKEKIKEHANANGRYEYYYKLVTDANGKEKYKINPISLLEYKTEKEDMVLDVKYKTYRTKTELGEMFLVDILVHILKNRKLVYGNQCDFAFFSESEMENFITESFRNKIQKVFLEIK